MCAQVHIASIFGKYNLKSSCCWALWQATAGETSKGLCQAGTYLYKVDLYRLGICMYLCLCICKYYCMPQTVWTFDIKAKRFKRNG